MHDNLSYIPIDWDDNFNIGIPEIDQQHKRLISILNNVGKLSAQEANNKNLLPITRDLLDYALFHFDYEEGLMRKYGYHVDAQDDVVTHKKQHQKFSEQVVSFREQLRVGDHISPGTILGFIRGWLVEHILVSDKKFGDYFVEKTKNKAS